MNSAKIASLITRGKIVQSRVAARTLLQITGLDNEVFQNIELLLPPGYVANPVAGGDVTILQANGVRSHAVALSGDNTADIVSSLQPGEFGLSSGGTRSILFKHDGIYVTDTQKIVLHAPDLYFTTDGTTLHKLALDNHTHPYLQGPGPVADTSPPDSGLT